MERLDCYYHPGGRLRTWCQSLCFVVFYFTALPSTSIIMIVWEVCLIIYFNKRSGGLVSSQKLPKILISNLLNSTVCFHVTFLDGIISCKKTSQSLRTYQPPLQRAQVGRRLTQQQTQFVADDVDLLLRLDAVLSRGLQEELRGDLLQRGDLPLPAAQLLLQSLQQGATESTRVRRRHTQTQFSLVGMIQRRFYIFRHFHNKHNCEK